MQRSPTIASVGDLVSDPWSSSAPKLLHEQKENPPWAEQGPATYSNCSSIPSGSSTGLVQRSAFTKVADVVNQTKSSAGLDFLTVG